MGSFMKIAALILSLVTMVASAADGPFRVGQKDYTFKDSARNRQIVTHVWYPIEATQKMRPVPAKNLFTPIIVAKGAPLLGGRGKKFPLILISHGSGGLAERLFWFTDPLVRQGSIVVGVDHPGNNTKDNTPEGVVRVWERAKDISFVLDQISKAPEWKDHIDKNQIGAAGHSAGGTTVLLLAGGRLSPEQFVIPFPNCEGSKDPYFAKYCESVKKIDFKSYPKDVVGGDYSDERIRGVVAFDPGYARSFDKESLKKLKAKNLVFVADKLLAPQGEIFSKDFLTLLPKEEVRVLPGSYHMTFLQPCKAKLPKGDPEIDELCVDNIHRPDMQTSVVETSQEFFMKTFSGR